MMSSMRNKAAVLSIALAGVLLLGGCVDNFTRENFEAVCPGQSMDEVRQTLGRPDYDFHGEWVYIRQSPYRRAKIIFSDDKVRSKEWGDADDPFGLD